MYLSISQVLILHQIWLRIVKYTLHKHQIQKSVWIVPSLLSLRGVRRRALELPLAPSNLLELPDASQKSPLLELPKSSPELAGVPKMARDPPGGAKRALEPPGVICNPADKPPISCIDSDLDLGGKQESAKNLPCGGFWRFLSAC